MIGNPNQNLYKPQEFTQTNFNITLTLNNFTMGSTNIGFKNSATSTLLELVKRRRTYYGLNGESPISDGAIEHIVQESVLHVPSSFNTQTSRVVLLLKEEHQKLWNIAINVMEALVTAGHIPKEMFENSTKPKLESFRAAYGTVCVIYWIDNVKSADY